MPYEDLVGEVEALVGSASPEARSHLNFLPDMTLGTGLSAARLQPPETFTPEASHLGDDASAAFAGFTRWHKALGNAVNVAAGPAAMAAQGFPVAALLGRGPYVRPEFGSMDLDPNDEEPLSMPEATFGLTTKVSRLLRPDYTTDIEGPTGFRRLAETLGGGRESAGFLQALGHELVNQLPSYRSYLRKSGDTTASIKAVAMLASQVEFADEWATFSFEGKAAPVVLREWHRLVTTGRGNADVAVDGVLKFARAVEWIQHPELLVSPVVGLAYMNLDDNEAAVGLRVAQWIERDIDELTDAELAARVKAAEGMHPSGLVEAFVDNVRSLTTEVMGSRFGDIEEVVRTWRRTGQPLPLAEVGHVAGLGRPVPSTEQMRRALRTVAAEIGRVDDQPVTPEELNGLARFAASRLDIPLAGAFEQIVSGRAVPRLESLRDIDAETDFRRYTDLHRNIRMEANAPAATDAITVMVEAAPDGSYKVMSEDGSSAFRNRAVGFIRHNHRQATVPVRPRPTLDARAEFGEAATASQPAEFFPLDAVAAHPAFAEGPMILLTHPAGEAMSFHVDRLVDAFTKLGASNLAISPHEAVLNTEDRRREGRAGVSITFPDVRSLHKAAEALARADSPLASERADGSVDLRFYVNTDMDQPPGTTKAWQAFARDDRGHVYSVSSAEGYSSRTDQVPYYTMRPVPAGETRTMGAARSLDQSEPWAQGDTIYMAIPPYGDDGIPTFAHDEAALAGADPTTVVAMTRQANGNVSVALPAQDGRVEVLLAKRAHEILRSMGRKSISMGTRS